MRASVRGEFGKQAREVVRAYNAGAGTSAIVNALNGADDAMLKAMEAQYVAAGNGVARELEKAYGYLAKPIPERIVDSAGSRITRMNTVTKRRVRRVLQASIKDNLSTKETATRLRAVVDDRRRVETITRTELATATNQAQEQVMREEGERHAQILDGDECGLTFHDDPDLADGKIVTLDFMAEYPISHPRCVRAYTPVER